MKRQNDWYTGIDHYDNHLEKEIRVEKIMIQTPGKQTLHNMVDMLCILSGSGTITVNGRGYKAEPGCLFCLYPHHFYRVEEVREKLTAVRVSFHIGLFMYMSWEKHPRHANARLVYDTHPMVCLSGGPRERVEALVLDLLDESRQDRFEKKNMIEYKTLELHAYFCRYAFERIGVDPKREQAVWSAVSRAMLTTAEDLRLEDLAGEACCSPAVLNRRIKEACGYTFFQLKQYGKMINACALLHFSDLSMEYIAGLLNFSSVSAFYRAFERCLHMTPRQYQELAVGKDDIVAGGGEIGMQFLQYMHLHFFDHINVDSLSEAFCLKPYTVKQIFDKVFGCGLDDLLSQIRICYACSHLITGNLSVLEISSMCGFESVSTFTRYFRRCMNQTPGQYRKYMQVGGPRCEKSK